MSGPPPKDPKLRARRNKTSTAATLSDLNPPASDDSGPVLPPLVQLGGEGDWHPYVLQWWDEIWASPMALEYTTPDVHGLVTLMHMQHRYWRGEHDLATEIRLQRQCYGLTSLDRRRLQWDIRRPEKPAEPQKRPERLEDPRSVLKAVS